MLYTASQTGQGAPSAYIQYVDGSGNSTYALSYQRGAGNRFRPDADQRQLRAGLSIAIWLGHSGGQAGNSASNVTVTIGAVNVPVLYAGPQGSYAGLDQVNVQVPASLAGRGQTVLRLTVGSIAQTANPVQVTIQ